MLTRQGMHKKDINKIKSNQIKDAKRNDSIGISPLKEDGQLQSGSSDLIRPE